MWMDVVRARGIDVTLTEGGRLASFARGVEGFSLRIRRLRRTPRPSEVNPGQRGEMLWLPAPTPALRTRLASLDLNWVSDPGEVHLHAPWGLVTGGSEDDSGEDAPSIVEPLLSPGARAVLQRLVEHPAPATQHSIAAAVGVSQPRVSQVLQELRHHGLAGRTGGGWQVTDADRAFDVCIRVPAAPPALTVYWFSLASVRDQIAAFRERAELDSAEARLCGDWAADLLAPWRQPRLIAVHADRTLQLEEAGFVPAPAGEATLVQHVGPIRPEWRAAPALVATLTGRTFGADPALAPVTEIAREMAATGGSDTEEAVAQLRYSFLRARFATPAPSGR